MFIYDIFYNNTASVIEYIYDKDERGRMIPITENIKDTFKCDIQPISQDRVQKDFGISKHCIYRIFANKNENIKIGNIIEISDKYYKIESIKEWDYLEFVVSLYDND